MERRGSCVFSSTMEEVPLGGCQIEFVLIIIVISMFRFTKLDDDSEMFLHDIDCMFATY